MWCLTMKPLGFSRLSCGSPWKKYKASCSAICVSCAASHCSTPPSDLVWIFGTLLSNVDAAYGDRRVLSLLQLNFFFFSCKIFSVIEMLLALKLGNVGNLRTVGTAVRLSTNLSYANKGGNSDSHSRDDAYSKFPKPNPFENVSSPSSSFSVSAASHEQHQDFNSLSKSKLYYSVKSVGAAAFICANLAKLPIQAEQVSLRTNLTASGKDFLNINPKASLPTLVIKDDGHPIILNESVAVLQYIADLVRELKSEKIK